MNFDFLKSHTGFEKLYKCCDEAEKLAVSFPSVSAASARKAMEFIVKFIYKSKVNGDITGLTVFDMLTDSYFEAFINDETVMSSFHYIRKMGNVAIHDADISSDEAMKILEELHFLVGEIAICLGIIEDYPVFEKPLMSAPVTDKAPEVTSEKIEVSSELVARFAEKMRFTHFDVKNKRDESENKKLYITASLREAGWPVVNQPDQMLPCSAGIQMLLDNGEKADYILSGRSNKALAIVVVSDNPVEGRMKGIRIADSMEAKLGYKPVIYYVAGYNIYCIDQLGYPPRRVFQFHTLSELELYIQRKSIRTDITSPVINDAITNRDYQKNAVTAVCKAFTENRRRSLLVMATGTGKTRVSISIVDVLMKANWIKNVLFLADRTSLVRQANKNFTKLLPNVTTSVYSGGSLDRDGNARIIFSTYQTMINLIEDDTREFSIGRFDLVIIDEAHRSIFNKYATLFHYFDSLIVGLTATPRCEENKSTYQMFNLPDGKPDFAYELEEAINDKHLVGFTVEDKTTDLMQRDIKYSDLSDKDKEKLEDGFLDGEDYDDINDVRITRDSFGARKLINIGTIDAMLTDLMKNGLRVNAGEKIGKTIIFASCHAEAEQIVVEFNKLFPNFGIDFCKLIDSHVENNLNLIDNFGERDSLPQIAVSVDMMDTGIDVPDVLNLVFFKYVRSKIKFLQMIGRGTRLCPDIYGPGNDKHGFIIFDYHDNFRYFSVGESWSFRDDAPIEKSFIVTPQSQLIRREKLGILRILQNRKTRNAFEENYYNELKSEFIAEVRSLCSDNIEVTYNMAYVSKYRTEELWDCITENEETELISRIIPLMPSLPGHPKSKTLDLIMYTIEHEYYARVLEGKDPRKIKHGFFNIGNLIDDYMEKLLKLKSIPAVTAKEQLIKSMRHGDYIFDNFSLERCEYVRNELRGLMTNIEDVSYVIVDIIDGIHKGDDNPGGTGHVQKSYADKVNDYLNSGAAVLAKIRNLDELTDDEKKELEEEFKSKLGTEADYAAWSGNAPLTAFVRTKIGIDDNAIKTKFGSFLNSNNLDDEQLEFMNQIISYARENGDITFMDLQKVSPFCDYDIMELFGAKIAFIKQLVNGLHKPVME